LSDRVSVSVPASSANLGPGFDSMAAALSPRLNLKVTRADQFSLQTELDVPTDRTNLLVRAFERVMPADGFAFEVESGIPLCGGLGSSASAVVAGVLAAEELGGHCEDALGLAIEVDGVADNAAAAMEGGVTINVGGHVSRLEPPSCVELLIIAPSTAVHTEHARKALPAQVELADAVANAGFAAVLGAGIAANDPELIAHGLHDRIHQSARSHLFPKSSELLGRATEFGALGATVSGAGPSVLVWCAAGDRIKVSEMLEPETNGWARLLDVEFDPVGAVVEVG